MNKFHLSVVVCMTLVPFTFSSIELKPEKPSTARLVSTAGTDAGTCEIFPCATVQYAINQSGFADVIEVDEGIYIEAGITIDRNTTIKGKGADKTIVQAVSTPPASDRVFDIIPGYKVVMYDLTVRYGYVEGDGGGIRVDRSALKLRNVTVDSNVAFEDENSTGGGIDVHEGWLDLDGCTISNNYASGGGGAVYLYYSDASLLNTTLSGNDSLIKGGGIGTLSDDPQTIEIVYSTIYDNTAVEIGGGLQLESNFSVVMANSIVAGNSAGTNGPDIYGEIASKDHNIIEDTTDTTINDIVAHNIYGQDAKLGALADNGGTTKTHALQPSSPAIDAAKCNSLLIDQRGQIRPIDKPEVVNVAGGCDIGAYEDGLRVNLPLVMKTD